MALILLEGLDKTGKSTVAQHFHLQKGYGYVHMTAPRKGISRAEYLGEVMRLIADTAGKNVVIDRTWYGELVWPYAYSRTPLLYQSDVKLLTDLAVAMHSGDVRRIYMFDPNEKAHKERMLAFKEPTYDYLLVKELYAASMMTNEFTFQTFTQAEALGWISKNA